MANFEWHHAVTQLQPHVVRISTPEGSGTGWLVSRSKTFPLGAIATAAHVIDHAHYWEEPIRIFHFGSEKSILLRPAERSVQLHQDSDTAAIVFKPEDLPLPDEPLPLMAKDKHLKPGVEIGWLGFPAIRHASLCFFSGRISAWIEEEAAYLVDGVAINGVSGGPAFRLLQGSSQLMGVVSAYIPNRATGDVLPGVAVVRDVTQYHGLADTFRSLDEAKAQETPPAESAPPAVDNEPPVRIAHDSPKPMEADAKRRRGSSPRRSA